MIPSRSFASAQHRDSAAPVELHRKRNETGSNTAFNKLIESISRVFEAQGDDLGSINHHAILDLMREYTSSEEDWGPYVKVWEEEDKPYVRNLVHPGNAKYNLV
jgi:hypothetical protein